MAEDERERRESGRAPMELPVEYERLNALLSDYTHNISRGGTFIRTEQPLAVGTSLCFTIRAPQLGDPLVLQGEVRWVVDAAQATEGRPPGMGIAFLYESPSQREEVESRLDALLLSELGPSVFEKLMGKAPPTRGG